MQKKRFKVLGLMSGSSLDGLDLALSEFHFRADASGPEGLLHWELLAADTQPYTANWRKALQDAPNQTAQGLLAMDADLGHYFGEIARTFLDEHSLQADFIASHGHTIFHHPEQRFTTQIGNGAGLAYRTGLTVIDNFRLADVAAGGQGAPIAPIADRYLFGEYDFCLNLGGIANVSCNANGIYLAFDIGGANQILDALVQPTGQAFDAGGRLAERGVLEESLLAATDDLRFFRQPYPKSLDNRWVRQHQVKPYLAFDAPLENKLHTACRQLAREISKHLQTVITRERFVQDRYRMLVTGGGAFNTFLLNCIEDAVPDQLGLELVIPSEQLISGKESIMIALMGCLRILGIPNTMASVTGADRDTIGGVIHGGNAIANQPF